MGEIVPLPPRPGVHHASVALKLGDRARITAEVRITSSGLLSIAALVAASLLGSAAIVLAARRALADRGSRPG